ncbi:MAG: hypothetical protein QXH73_04515 [Ignisphaera sp.]
MSTSEVEFRCRNCGGPLEVSPETIAIVCSYCGFLNWIREDLKEEVLVVKPLKDKDVLNRLRSFASRERLGEIFSPSNLSRTTVVLVPFYFVDVSAEAEYSGTVAVDIRKCRSVGNQTRCWVETHKVHVRGVYGPAKDVVPVPGRRGSNVLSIKALAYRYMMNRVDAVPLANAELDKSIWRSILSIEVDRKIGLDIAIDSHLDVLRKTVEDVMKKEAERKVSGGSIIRSRIIWKKITPRNVKAVSSPAILLPMYILMYRYGGEVYRAVVCGWNGDVIVLERPMKKIDRIIWSIGASLSSGLCGGLAIPMIVAGDEIGLGIGLILIIAGGYASWYCMKKVVSPVKSSLIGVNLKELKKYSESSSANEVHKIMKFVDSMLSTPRF